MKKRNEKSQTRAYWHEAATLIGSIQNQLRDVTELPVLNSSAPLSEQERRIVERACSGLSALYQIAATKMFEEMEKEEADNEAIQKRMADILTQLANVIKGPPGALSLHDWSSLPKDAKKLVRKARKLGH